MNIASDSQPNASLDQRNLDAAWDLPMSQTNMTLKWLCPGG